MTADISVICTFLDAEDTITATLDSLREQTDVTARFILVDDGTRDRSTAIAERVCASDARFSLFTNPNPGRIRALNLALGKADTAFIAILDADDVAHPTWLRDGLKTMRARPEFAVVGFARLFIRGQAQPEWTDALKPAVADVEDVTRLLARGNAIGHSGSLICKQRLDEAGGYDESLACLEDYDLWIRLAESGNRLARSRLMRVAKRYHGGQKFGHAQPVLRASRRMQWRAIIAIDRDYRNFLRLGLRIVRDGARRVRRAVKFGIKDGSRSVL